MFGITKTHVGVAVTALVAIAIVVFIQKKVMPIPIIGAYLPGGTQAGG